MIGITKHTSHSDIIKRLRWDDCDLKKIIMMKEGHGCLDIAQQLQAVESAAGNAKKTTARISTAR